MALVRTSCQGELYGDAATFLNAQEYKNLNAWADKIAQRPAIKRAINIAYKDIK